MTPLALWLEAVIVAVTEEVPRVLTVRRIATAPGLPEDALPYGPLDPANDRTLELGLRRWVRERAGLTLGYVEQLYTFGDLDRYPPAVSGDARVISSAYLALVHEVTPVPGGGEGEAAWRDAYACLPWEDWRDGRPALIDERIAPAIREWIEGATESVERAQRSERAEIAFGLGQAGWAVERVLERYELLYELGLVAEAAIDRLERDGASEADGSVVEAARRACAEGIGRPMALDHRRILATALGRIRGKLAYRPVVFELVPETFTLLHLQRVVEALSGVQLHKANFRRLLERGGLVEGTGRFDSETGGRPAERFRFRREVLRERRAPGVGLPGG